VHPGRPKGGRISILFSTRTSSPRRRLVKTGFVRHLRLSDLSSFATQLAAQMGIAATRLDIGQLHRALVRVVDPTAAICGSRDLAFRLGACERARSDLRCFEPVSEAGCVHVPSDRSFWAWHVHSMERIPHVSGMSLANCERAPTVLYQPRAAVAAYPEPPIARASDRARTLQRERRGRGP